MSFLIYDVALLILFAIGIGVFLYSRRKRLQKEGLLYLYKTSWGIKFINYVGGKYKRTLSSLSYISVGLGYILMAVMIYLFGKIIWVYVAMPSVVKAIKVPPIMPLVPYIDKLIPGIPSFYFVYWIIIIAIIAVPHEFFHGIFMRRYGIKIKSTGFGFFPTFLPIFLAAFVEQDEKSMNSKKKFEQMAVLSAGTFANILTAILFFAIMILFFSFAFAPSGVVFDSYSYSFVNPNLINSVNGISVEDSSYEGILNLLSEDGLDLVQTINGNYILTKELMSSENSKGFFESNGLVLAYDDAPAINANLQGAITKVNGVEIQSVENLATEIRKYSTGDEITITTFLEEEKEQKIVLGENPYEEGSPWLGVGFNNAQSSGIMGKFYDLVSSFKESHVYYSAKFGAGSFIYDLLWWTVLISISVALINMLPMGIFDGGRFFYLTIWGITRNEKIAKRAFKGITYFLLFLLLVLMVFWAINLF